MSDGEPPRAGVVLAGGYSTRFGDSDKAVADLAGTPMVRRVVDRLATAVDGVVVNCRRDQVGPLRGALAGRDDVALAVDPVADRGPTAGIRNGLRAVSADYAAVVACDMPLVDPALLAHLFERAAGRDAAVVQTDAGWYQTTQAVYRTATVEAACGRALAAEDSRVLAALADLDVAVVTESEVREVASPRSFEDVNTEADLAAVEAAFRDG